MKLDRNINANGMGKYALINLRTGQPVNDCGPGQEHEFFVIMLKDVNAGVALEAYADAAQVLDPEWAEEVRRLSDRAGLLSRFCRRPD